MRRTLMTAMLAFASLVPLTAHGAEMRRDKIEVVIKDYLASHRDDVGDLVKSYLLEHPDALRDVLIELVKRHAPAKPVASSSAPAADIDHSAEIEKDADLLFSSPRQVTLGNRDGDVTLVEFFDYNCGFCRRALPDLVGLLGNDPKLKVVLKEFPILGPASAEAARVAIAVHMQDPDGSKYLAFHRRLLANRGRADKDSALAAAREEGLDMARIEQDMASEDVGKTLEEDIKLAAALGITGTPGYVVGKTVVLGAVGSATLKSKIAQLRTPADR